LPTNVKARQKTPALDMASESSERFELCSEEAETLLDQVEASIEQLQVAKQKGKVQGKTRPVFLPDPHTGQGASERRKIVESRCRDDLKAAIWAVEEAEAEAKKAPADFRGDMLAQVRKRRTRLAKLHSDLRRVVDELQRAELYEDSGKEVLNMMLTMSHYRTYKPFF